MTFLFFGGKTMFLSQTDLYALRAMVHLALQGADHLVPSAELAEATHIPPHYLSKIMRRLVEAGLVVSQKGHHGGFQICRPLESITLADILHIFRDDEPLDACAFGWERCDARKPCPLHDVWGDLRQSFRRWSEETNLSKLRSWNISQRFPFPPETSHS